MEERDESEEGDSHTSDPTNFHIAFTMRDTESDQCWGWLGLACETRRESEMGGKKNERRKRGQG